MMHDQFQLDLSEEDTEAKRLAIYATHLVVCLRSAKGGDGDEVAPGLPTKGRML